MYSVFYAVYIILHSKLLTHNFIFLISLQLASKFNVSVTKMLQFWAPDQASPLDPSGDWGTDLRPKTA